ncbi:acyl-CoA dehydrogenase family protein [Alloalcanivorax venustensis]|jgi:alkylation response protein AidB-like acyl-CoA dehydrogenase|uniref:Acyl-CoA dehydrogenase family protein n=1 Tax=Alloalcanivorax venustensis ISO4 TaxID=1177184 RepID=A0ABS0AEZ3_9GAMM|nr:acyl-CoA dehydrogenase family protein [Alloalcanivorax venustensis]KXJ47720.1 MAG: pimeloyl-CoA dehydrogenase large subunit [Alcanivorax sp. Nap_24]MCH2553003.1 acyl-CoA dehydrogenase family protein [Alcanivorax sp.]MCH9783933.1 acyl-CoA dehydrogenase family protein [Gammaproteobacteria bacterium]MEA3259737.1 acyl-CoA dehydrogenase family protein [Pseudomonadota bacterium]SMO55228.1 Acyl-CoA dehydrogenase [Alcanivorax sp. DSM 26295]|tara:strand:- start:184 stop:1383 length:1200 start_codon:yes stop_codon:yes gene_type:complete
MDINYTAEERAFRDEVRTFLNEKLPKDISSKVKEHKRLGKEDTIRWQKILNEQGWLALHWPKEYGGTGWSPIQKHIFEEECAEAGAPTVLPFGVNMVAPVIIKFGTQEQKDYYLPRILRSDDWWCQGYSEPGAGSDLAGLKTRAVRDGDHYIVNGQKTWTTLGQHANMIFCLVRTDPDAKKQEGISFLLIDMEKSEGITVRPLITLDGEHEVNEVFFDDVKVPVENLVGEENKGWTCAKYLLTFERTGIAGVGSSKAALAHLKQVAREQQVNGKPLIEEPHFRSRLADVEMELMSLEMTNLRTVAAAEAGGVPGAESSFLKIMGTELRQEITDLFRRAAGPHALPFLPEQLAGDFDGETVGPEFAGSVASRYFNFRKLSIFGGSNEIQKNIISKMILGL